MESRLATDPAELIAAVRVVRQHLSYVSGGPFQYAMAAGLRLPDVLSDQFREGLAQQRDRLCDGLADLGLRVIAPQGTYFATTGRAAGRVRHRRGIWSTQPLMRPVSWRFRSRP